MDDIRHIRCSDEEAINMLDEIAEGPFKRVFSEQSDDGTWHIAKIEDASWACVLCDQFDPWEEDPARRCTKGRDCLSQDESCPLRTTAEADEIYGETDGDEHRRLSMEDLDLEPPAYKSFETAYEDYEVSRLRADLCLSDPGSYSMEEKAAICGEMQETRHVLDEAMKRDIRTWPLELQERFVKEAADDVRDEAWWRRFLME